MVAPVKPRNKGGRPKGKKKAAWLSDGELEVVKLMIEGYTTRQISEKLGISFTATSGRMSKAKAKCKAKTLYELVAIAQRRLLGHKEDEDGRHWRAGEEGDSSDRADHASESRKEGDTGSGSSGAGKAAR